MNGVSNEGDEPQIDPAFAARLRARREQREANERAVADGTADPRVLEVLERVYPATETAGPDWADSMRKHAVMLVTDEFDRATEAGKGFDPDEVVPRIEREIRKDAEKLQKGLASMRSLNSLGSQLRAVSGLGVMSSLNASAIRAEAAESRRELAMTPPQSPSVPLLKASPSAPTARSERSNAWLT